MASFAPPDTPENRRANQQYRQFEAAGMPGYQRGQQSVNGMTPESQAFNQWRAGGGSQTGSNPSGGARPVDMSAYNQQGGQSGGAYSAYSPQPQYNASNVPRTPPQGVQRNDLSGNVPSNQVWGQAYNQAAGQFGLPPAQSWTNPGSFTSQGYNPTTGQYGPMTGGQSNAGNMAYNAINNRPSPVTAYGTGVGGDQMSFQDTMSQREAFAGNLSQRLNQYSGGQLTGPVTFDPSQLLSQANDQLANGTFSNPFAQNARPYDPSRNPVQPVSEDVNRQRFNPDVQRAMGNANQYMQGNFQNPFGQQANVPQPSFGQQSYNPNDPTTRPNELGPQAAQTARASSEDNDRIFRENYGRNPANWVYYDPGTGMATHGLPAGNPPAIVHPRQGERDLGNDIYGGAGLRPDGNRGLPPSNPRNAPNVPSAPAGGGTTYQPGYAPPPQPERRNAPNVPSTPARSGGQQPQATTQAEMDRLNNRSGSARPRAASENLLTETPRMRFDPMVYPTGAWVWDNPAEGKQFERQAGVSPPRPSGPPMPTEVVFTPEQQANLQAQEQAYNQRQADQARRVLNEARPVPPPSQGTPYNPRAQAQGLPDIPQNNAESPSAATEAQLAKIDGEINKWQQATYGTRTGGGPPPEWQSHIQALQRLRNRAEAGDAAALAWSPKMKAPPPHVTPTVPVNRRGDAARFGGLRQNGDNRR
jgi:hypothetical protein